MQYLCRSLSGLDIGGGSAASLRRADAREKVPEAIGMGAANDAKAVADERDDRIIDRLVLVVDDAKTHPARHVEVDLRRFHRMSL